MQLSISGGWPRCEFGELVRSDLLAVDIVAVTLSLFARGEARVLGLFEHAVEVAVVKACVVVCRSDVHAEIFFDEREI
jgi:hypothetical protein